MVLSEVVVFLMFLLRLVSIGWIDWMMNGRLMKISVMMMLSGV